MDRKSFVPAEVKFEAPGQIELAFAQLNVVDHDGDLTLPGAFPAKDVPMSSYGHGSWDGQLPVGKGTITERGDWAVFTGEFFMNSQAARDTYETIKGLGPLAEYSYGYQPIDHAYETRDGSTVRVLKRLDVFEVSPVLKGAGIGTHTLAIKSGAPASDAPYASQFAWYSDELPALLDRFKGHAAARASEGRKLSRADRAALEDLVETLGANLATARELLAPTETPKASRDATLDVLLGIARSLGVATA